MGGGVKSRVYAVLKLGYEPDTCFAVIGWHLVGMSFNFFVDTHLLFIFLTMRHIQLYFIIVKSRTPAEGRIPYLSRKQRLRLKSLFLRSNYVTLSWHLDALKAGTLLCGSCFYLSPGDALWVAVTPRQIAVTKHNFTWTGCPYRWPFSSSKRKFTGLTFWETGYVWISCIFH